MTFFHFLTLLTFNLIVGSFSKKLTMSFLVFFSVVFVHNQSIEWFNDQEASLQPVTVLDLFIEAENGQLIGTPAAFLDNAASNGQFVTGAYNQTNIIRYSINAPRTQTYQLTVGYALADVLQDRNYYVYRDGVLLHTEFMQTTGTASDYVPVTFDIDLDEGINNLDTFTDIGSFRHDYVSIYGEYTPVFDNLALIQLILGSILAWICISLKDITNFYR